MSTKNLAVAYIRGSTEEQRNTLEAQRTQIEAYCAAFGITLAQVFVDSGESAYKVMFYERPVVREMRDYMARTGIKQLVITKLDRAFRNTKDCLSTVDDLDKKGVHLHIIDLKVDTATPHGRFFLTLMAAMAEMENGVRSARQRDGFAAMKRQGHRCGEVPYGWKAIPSSRTNRAGQPTMDLVPDEKEQETLRFILEQLKDYSFAKVADALNAAGIPSKRGGKWHASTVHSVAEHARLAEPKQKAA